MGQTWPRDSIPLLQSSTMIEPKQRREDNCSLLPPWSNPSFNPPGPKVFQITQIPENSAEVAYSIVRYLHFINYQLCDGVHEKPWILPVQSIRGTIAELRWESWGGELIWANENEIQLNQMGYRPGQECWRLEGLQTKAEPCGGCMRGCRSDEWMQIWMAWWSMTVLLGP